MKWEKCCQTLRNQDCELAANQTHCCACCEGIVHVPEFRHEEMRMSEKQEFKRIDNGSTSLELQIKCHSCDVVQRSSRATDAHEKVKKRSLVT